MKEEEKLDENKECNHNWLSIKELRINELEGRIWDLQFFVCASCFGMKKTKTRME